MNRRRAARYILGLSALALAILAVPQFTSTEVSVVPDAGAGCLIPDPCNPPGAVVCPDGHFYPSCQAAAAACQYRCRPAVEEP